VLSSPRKRTAVRNKFAGLLKDVVIAALSRNPFDGWLENLPKALQLASWQQAHLEWMPAVRRIGQARHDKFFCENTDT